MKTRIKKVTVGDKVTFTPQVELVYPFGIKVWKNFDDMRPFFSIHPAWKAYKEILWKADSNWLETDFVFAEACLVVFHGILKERAIKPVTEYIDFP